MADLYRERYQRQLCEVHSIKGDDYETFLKRNEREKKEKKKKRAYLNSTSLPRRHQLRVAQASHHGELRGSSEQLESHTDLQHACC